MAIRDYWVYQKRQAETPWALYIVKEYDKRKGLKATALDWTIYSENITDNSAHSKSRVGIQAETLGGYVEELLDDLADVSVVELADVEQVTQALERILLD